MGKSLLIVESPTKVNTLKKIVGKDFIIKASVGHLKDLPKKKLGVDVDNDFAPEYITIRGKGKILQELKRETIEKSDKSRMLSGTINGKFFRLICQLLNATQVLEIGTYTGYSALCMAEGMAENGKLITCDFDEETTKIDNK